MVLASLFELGEALYEQKKYDETIAFAHVYQFIDLEVYRELYVGTGMVIAILFFAKVLIRC